MYNFSLKNYVVYRSEILANDLLALYLNDCHALGKIMK